MHFKLIIFLLTTLAPFQGFMSTKIKCNYQSFGANGCPEDRHLVCNNVTKECECNPSAEFVISFGDTECLAVRTIDQKCVTDRQCLKSKTNQLFCYYFDSKAQKLVKLNDSFATNWSQRLNQTIDGFCRCDDNYYYDYEDNQCVHQNTSRDYDINLRPLIDDFFCRQCPAFDGNSYCDPKTQNCLCIEGFVKNSYGKCVRRRQLYDKCSQPTDECIVSHSYCEPIVSQCICSSGYTPDPYKQQCMKSRLIFDQCSQQRECNYLYGFCDPFKKQCLCDNASVLLNTYPPICVLKTSYGHSCHHQFPDLICQQSVRHSICSKHSNHCVCRNGYIFMANECQRLDTNGFEFDNDFEEMDSNKNPMTYILIVFCSVFGLTIFASILIKIFRKPFTRTQLSLYDINDTLNRLNTNSDVEVNEPRRPPSAPPLYTESALRTSTQTSGSHNTYSDNEDKPPSYEEAISGQYSNNNCEPQAYCLRN